jgi:cytochrome c oxidase subunit 2
VSDQDFVAWVESAKKKFATLPGNTYASADTGAH